MAINRRSAPCAEPLRRRWLLGAGCLLMGLVADRARGGNHLTAARARLLDEIDQDIAASASATGRGALAPTVRRAMATVPREQFIPADLADHAYDNRPLPIGDGQTISQPTIVAMMTDLLEPQATDRVLEIGTGSGYQAAVLAECVGEVYSIEIIAPLAARARAALDAAGYQRVRTRVGDGYAGWPEAAPFDGIIVTAAPDHVPAALVEQLRPGARLVIPVGPRAWTQQLLVIRKEADGRAVTRRTIPVRFVPLTRGR